MAGKKAQASQHRKLKYSNHPAIAIRNKLRSMKKHFKNNPNDNQTGDKL